MTVVEAETFGDQQLDGVAAQFVIGIVEHLAQFGVGVDDIARPVDEHNRDRGRRHEQTQ